MATDAKAQSVPKIVIETHQWEELFTSLERYAPDRPIWAFGSRGTGKRVRRFSDLNILIGGAEWPFKDLAALREALDDPRLPFKVDIVQFAHIAAEFHARVQADLVLLRPDVN